MFQKMQDLVFLDEFYLTGLIYKTAAVLQPGLHLPAAETYSFCTWE